MLLASLSKMVVMLENRIKEVRKAKGITLETLADATGFSVSYLNRMESGERNISLVNLNKIAGALRINAIELLSEGAQMVAIVGYVGAGQEVYPVDDYPIGEGLDKISAPSGLGDIVAVIIRGNSMSPRYDDGDIVFYKRDLVAPVELIGKECVVRLPDGRMFVKKLLRGADPGTLTLFSHNAPPLENQVVEWAAPVVWVDRTQPG